MKPRGVLVATVSPFDREGSLSLEGYRKHLEFLAGEGVDGFVPCGTTGESPTLSREERIAQFQIAGEVAESRKLTVIAGCGGNSTSQVLELVREAEKVGCHGALVVSPYYNKPTAEGLRTHFLHLADRAKIPLVLYNIPGRSGVSLSTDLVGKLFEHENIVGIKESSGQYGYWLSLAETMNHAKKSLLAGDDDAFAPIGALGGCGIISASANVVPALFVQMQRHLDKGELTEVFRLQKKIAPLIRALFLETNPAPTKYALHRTRGMENSLRLPLVPVGKATEMEIQKTLKQLEAVH